MAKRDRLSGNEAVAEALRQINPDVMAAFPITPSTKISCKRKSGFRVYSC